MFTRQSRTQLWLVLALTTLFLLLMVRMRSAQNEQTRRLGRLTAQQVMEQSVPLCRTIATGSSPLEFSADSSDGAAFQYWSVTCDDPNGKQVAALTWNAASGKLITIGAWAHDRADTVPYARPQIEQVGRTWLGVLGFAHCANQWQLARAPERSTRRVWMMLWQGEGHHAMLQLSPVGKLLNGNTW